MSPKTFEPLLKRLSERFSGEDYVFPAGKTSRRQRQRTDGRHLSPRTVERVMQRAVRIAGIRKKATPHSLRHSFACHTYEYTCDLRKIQQILGHVRLETTKLYVQLAQPIDGQAVTSPLDVLTQKQKGPTNPSTGNRSSVGALRIHLQPESNDKPEARSAKVTLEIHTDARPVFLTGIVAREVRRGWVNLEIPPLEQWEESLRWLSRRQRKRIEDASFYELLQRQLPQRLQQLPKP